MRPASADGNRWRNPSINRLYSARGLLMACPSNSPCEHLVQLSSHHQEGEDGEGQRQRQDEEQDQQRTRIGEIERPAEAEATLDEDRRVAGVGVDAAELPVAVIHAVGGVLAIGAEPGAALPGTD